MSATPTQPATQPDPAEGPRDGGGVSPDRPNQGVSAEAPAEGADDVAPQQPGSPKG